MATMDATKVGIGAASVTGAIFVAPKGTTLPTNATTALTNAFKLLGFTSDAGVTISESTSKNDLRAWEGRTVVASPVTEYTENVAFMPIQCNDDVAKLIWGDDNVAVGTGGSLTVKHHGKTMEPVCIVIETTPRTGIVKRYCGTFQLTERGEHVMDGTQVEGRQLTFTAIADSSGYTMYEYTAFVAGSSS